MTSTTKIQPITQDLQILIDETLSPEARSSAVAEFARGEIADAERVNERALGVRSPYKTWVDGELGRALEKVNPDRGRIVVEFDVMVDILVDIANLLIQNSPLGDPENGHYRDNHIFFADGVQVYVGSAPPAKEYLFLNPTPYSRKIEAGSMSMRVPGSDHVYERTRQTASRRYGMVAAIRFTYESIAGGGRSPALRIIPK